MRAIGGTLMSKLNYSKKYNSVFSYSTKGGMKYGYRLTYYDDLHRRHEKQKRGFNNPQSAYRESLNAKVDIINNKTGALSAETITVRQWSKQFMEANRTHWKISTFKDYQSRLRQYILPSLGDISLKRLTKSKYQTLMLNPMIEQGLKRWTIRGAHKTLMTIINAAVDEGLLTKNPLSRTPIPDTGHIEKRIMSKAELQKFNYQLDQESLTTQLMLYTLEQTGMRQGELMGLQWQDIDLDNLKIHIKHTRDFNGLRTTKTPNSVRTVSISTSLAKIYHNAYHEQLELFFKHGLKVKPTTFVLISKHRLLPLNNKYVSLKLRNTLEHAKLDYLIGHFTAHTFRHQYASYLLNSGVAVSEVSASLGHASPEVTLSIYTEKTPMKKDNLADKFNNLW